MDPDELARLIDRYAAPLELYARQWCSDPADVVQAAFVKLIEQSTPPDHPAPWLHRVVKNLSLSRRRTAQRRQAHETQAGRMQPNWFEPSLVDGMDSETAAAALAELPEKQREAVIARIWSGLTFDEIGTLTETSSSTAHRLYEAGLEGLRKKLGVPCQKTP